MSYFACSIRPSVLRRRQPAPAGQGPCRKQRRRAPSLVAGLFLVAGLGMLPASGALAQSSFPPPPASTEPEDAADATTELPDLEGAEGDLTAAPQAPPPGQDTDETGTAQHPPAARDERLNTEDDAPEPEGPTLLEARLGLQSLWAQDKVLVGPTLRLGKGMFFGEFETHLMWTTDRPDTVERPFLGSQYGLYLELMPLRTRYVELSAGVGVDIFHLWGLHGDEFQTSLSTKVQAHVRVTRQLGAMFGARAYPVSASGVDLGETRGGDRGMPVLLSTGLEWTW